MRSPPPLSHSPLTRVMNPVLNKLADLMERDAQHLGELESVNGGKGLRIARDFDVGDSVACMRYYAGWADGKVTGESIEVSAKTKLVYTLNEPIGVWLVPSLSSC